jgi:hypothetical protein
VATAHPEKVVTMQQRLETVGKESAKPLALVYILQAGLKPGSPVLPTDEAFYTDDNDDLAAPKIGTAH